MTPEAKVKNILKQGLKRLHDCWMHMPPGGIHGKRGVPDFLFILDGTLYAVEAKAEGKKPTAIQDMQLMLIARAGGFSAAVCGEDEAKDFMTAINMRRDVPVDRNLEIMGWHKTDHLYYTRKAND